MTATSQQVDKGKIYYRLFKANGKTKNPVWLFTHQIQKQRESTNNLLKGIVSISGNKQMAQLEIL